MIEDVHSTYHPSDVINRHILDSDPSAIVAVTHDDEWTSVLKEADNDIPDDAELVRRYSNIPGRKKGPVEATIFGDEEIKRYGIRKEALLIGISSGISGYPALPCAHKDVLAMRDLLIAQYGYQLADINILIEDGIAGNPQPTRANILAAMAALVKDARSNDEFFFHYCGHSTQIQNLDQDGMDECLIPLDGETMKIELKAALVAPLHVDSHLVAVLDTCHSESLLDLKHSRCNRVFIPWLHRGKRYSDDPRTQIGRRGTLADYGSTFTMLRVDQPSRTSFTGVRSQRNLFSQHNLFNMDYESQVPSPLIRNISPIRTSSRTTSWPSPVLRTTVARPRTTSLRCDMSAQSDKVNAQENNDAAEGLSSAIHNESWLYADTLRCEYPDSSYPCDGWSRYSVTVDAMKANVVSLASCKDSELTREDETGISMTLALIEILKVDPNPPYKDMLEIISEKAARGTTERSNREAGDFARPTLSLLIAGRPIFVPPALSLTLLILLGRGEKGQSVWVWAHATCAAIEDSGRLPDLTRASS
ncbi:caspase domain-containing protein [Mycena rebaudengoi]|nr:caspase domain-containing protein [Mycena rebaudengoi]